MKISEFKVGDVVLQGDLIWKRISPTLVSCWMEDDTWGSGSTFRFARLESCEPLTTANVPEGVCWTGRPQVGIFRFIGNKTEVWDSGRWITYKNNKSDLYHRNVTPVPDPSKFLTF